MAACVCGSLLEGLVPASRWGITLFSEQPGADKVFLSLRERDNGERLVE